MARLCFRPGKKWKPSKTRSTRREDGHPALTEAPSARCPRRQMVTLMTDFRYSWAKNVPVAPALRCT